MVWLDALLSISLPFLVMGVFAAAFAWWMQHTAFKPDTIERVRAKNPVQPGEQERARRALAGWESPLDADVQRLRRKSLGL